MKKFIWIIIVFAVLGVGYYLISPIFNTIEKNEESPLFKDNLDSMDAKTKAEFEKQVEDSSDSIKEMQELMDEKAKLIIEADFKPRAHDVKGRALLIENNDEKIIRFEDFETINGPNLHIYLSTDLGDDDFIDLGEIKGTKGNVNYELPDNIDTTKYNKVLVWCVPFKVLFSYADLSQ